MRVLLAHVVANLRYCVKNRVMIVLAVILLGWLGLSLVPQFFILSAGRRFDIVRTVLQMLTHFVYFLVPLMGISILHHHVQNRSIKMVLTKPWPVETWVLGQFLTVASITLAASTFIALVGVVSFAVEGISFDPGILVVIGIDFLHTMILFSVLHLLTSLLHPVVAVTVSAFLNDKIWYGMILLFMAAEKAAERPVYKLVVPYLRRLVETFYWLLPCYDPFSRQTMLLRNTFRADAAHGEILLLTALYALAVAGVSFLLSTAVLRRRRHI